MCLGGAVWTSEKQAILSQVGAGVAASASRDHVDTARFSGKPERRRHAMMRLLAACLGAGVLTRLGTQSAQAANSDPVLAGQTVDATVPTRVRNGVSYTTDSTADGVQGDATGGNNSGLFGRNNVSNGIGVSGAAPSGTGVFGESVNGYGVGAKSMSGIGVNAVADSGSGIEGRSTSGDGIHGYSDGNLKYALAGSGGSQAHGVVGVSVNQYGVSGINLNGNQYAGAFFRAGVTAEQPNKDGVFVQGRLVVTGSKSRGVTTQSFGHRMLYAVEATGNYFEDFGRARLQNGRVRVDLDTVFAETVNSGIDYHVFLTPRAETRGLFVTGSDARGFTAQEAQGGAGNYEFDYRIVAKARGQEADRLRSFTPPALPAAPGGTSLTESGASSPASPSVPTATYVPTAATPTAPAASQATSTPTATPTLTSMPLPTTPTTRPTGSPSAT
jgi:hypothetical protein